MIENIEEFLTLNSYDEIIENHNKEKIEFLDKFSTANENDFILKRLNIIEFLNVPFSKLKVAESKKYDIRRYSEYLNDLLNENKTDVIIKLKWLGKPAHLGFIFKELAEKGFIEVPKRKDKLNRDKYAKLLMQLFEVFPKDTTPENLGKELGDSPSISPETELKFKIPKLKDL